ncbi:kinesin [Salmonella enterica subsp. enterica]|uniref:Kinesin n=1 Tax=Salmonella newport TaxID=108619 RepID=A0A5Y0RWU9_SALNE|nr:kinesin [Salmonella enterica]EBS2908568.1 kinesin [Salmonella enterica subsp. enterica serovar Flottbek]EBS4086117.1 kinesin [Salmonella enterica subsp. enterica serovar Newport]ECC9721170.1 kinesin [Salmonella enterica subsp. diarizonae]EDP8833894.1 kinesin [Salmonella enterica subsp. enterica]
MDFFYKVKMLNQWRFGVGGFVDLNCGWYCQNALLLWYCERNNLPINTINSSVKYNRTSFGFNPTDSLCRPIFISNNIFDYRDKLLKYGPIIVSGKVGLANFSPLGGISHYVLIVGVRTKTNDIIIYDPLSISFRNLKQSDPKIYKFNCFVKNIDETLIINSYSVNTFINYK